MLNVGFDITIVNVASQNIAGSLLGMLFVMPQYLQPARGHNAFGTGLRLPPLDPGRHRSAAPREIGRERTAW
ncbi:hypothetical protein [Micromonospora avicenniae]|uniref:hypothetical protein n=1 Tax=Micromonospora avicenniae TaxID=1198245 RepID=UPI003446BF87